MSDYISDLLRQQVALRAADCCEYCGLSQNITTAAHHVDHVIPRRHAGQTELGNLALACAECNRNKGPNLSGIDPESGEITPLFNPRVQIWAEHFVASEGQILGITAIGRASMETLRLNQPHRVAQRLEFR